MDPNTVVHLYSQIYNKHLNVEMTEKLGERGPSDWLSEDLLSSLKTLCIVIASHGSV